MRVLDDKISIGICGKPAVPSMGNSGSTVTPVAHQPIRKSLDSSTFNANMSCWRFSGLNIIGKIKKICIERFVVSHSDVLVLSLRTMVSKVAFWTSPFSPFHKTNHIASSGFITHPAGNLLLGLSKPLHKQSSGRKSVCPSSALQQL